MQGPKENVDLKGQLGKMDPEKPVDPEFPPIGDDDWFKVEVPTKLVYYTNQSDSSDHKMIESSQYNVTNRSIFLVMLTASAFVGQGGTITSLNIKNQGTLSSMPRRGQNHL